MNFKILKRFIINTIFYVGLYYIFEYLWYTFIVKKSMILSIPWIPLIFPIADLISSLKADKENK